jgi:hypothetical protein
LVLTLVLKRIRNQKSGNAKTPGSPGEAEKPMPGSFVGLRDFLFLAEG